LLCDSQELFLQPSAWLPRKDHLRRNRRRSASRTPVGPLARVGGAAGLADVDRRHDRARPGQTA